MKAEDFLRSINIVYDAEEPRRIGHFRPTTKSTVLLRKLLLEDNERAHLIVAPYGSGKSITAAFALHALENRDTSREIVREIAQRCATIDAELGKRLKARHRSVKKRGIAIAIQGSQPNMPRAIKHAILEAMARQKMGRQARTIEALPAESIEDAITLLQTLEEKLINSRADRILILWDEFGRHVEGLITDGRSEALNEIQQLAEYCARTKGIPVVMALLMHQGLLRYAGSVSQRIRSEWTKVEGRFETLQYIDDSRQIYSLIADLAASRNSKLVLGKRDATKAASECHAHGVLTEFSKRELADILHRAYPLEPLALYQLPRLSARMAQNERTLFSFLNVISLDRPISLADLYDYFSSTMRGDVSVGGTYRQWVETESARSKIGDSEIQDRILKTACLLGLGSAGGRSRASRSLVEFGALGYGNEEEVITGVSALLDSKLLLHRKHSDELSIWHGTDVDLRTKLDDEKSRLQQDFDVIGFLSVHSPPSSWRATAYSAEMGVRRFAQCRYVDEEELAFELDQVSFGDYQVPSECDAQVLYLVDCDPDGLDSFVTSAKKCSEPLLLLVIPSEPLQLREAALEVYALERLQHDSELVGQDPLILPEIQQMKDDAELHLQKILDRIALPNSNAARWFNGGSELSLANEDHLRDYLSSVMRKVYSLTPKLRNELVVKNRPTPVIVNARKKLSLAILERSGMESLGIEGNFPDASLFRTLLLHTGIYRESSMGWRWAAPQELQDSGLQELWSKFQTFMTDPGEKSFENLFAKIMGPPIGLRAGVVPIFLSAALKAFPAPSALTKAGEYIDDILPSTVEDICKFPESYTLRVIGLKKPEIQYLAGVLKLLAKNELPASPNGDLVRQCHDALEWWKSSLPPAALTTARVSPAARNLQPLLTDTGDPVDLLLRRLILAVDKNPGEPVSALPAIEMALSQLEGIVDYYRKQASASVFRAIRSAGNIRKRNVCSAAREWADHFPEELIAELSDGVAKGLIARMRIPYREEQLLLDSLASLLIGKATNRWDDSSEVTFDRTLQDIVHRVEEEALSKGTALSNSPALKEGVAELLKDKLALLYGRLEELVGSKEAKKAIQVLQDGARSQRKRRGKSKRGIG